MTRFDIKYVSTYLTALARTSKTDSLRWRFVKRYALVYSGKKPEKLRYIQVERHLRRELDRAIQINALKPPAYREAEYFSPQSSHPPVTLLRKPGKMVNTYQVLRLIREQP